MKIIVGKKEQQAVLETRATDNSLFISVTTNDGDVQTIKISPDDIRDDRTGMFLKYNFRIKKEE